MVMVMMNNPMWETTMDGLFFIANCFRRRLDAAAYQELPMDNKEQSPFVKASWSNHVTLTLANNNTTMTTNSPITTMLVITMGDLFFIANYHRKGLDATTYQELPIDNKEQSQVPLLESAGLITLPWPQWMLQLTNYWRHSPIVLCLMLVFWLFWKRAVEYVFIFILF